MASLKSYVCGACCCLKDKISESRGDSKEKDVESCNQNEKTTPETLETSAGTDVGPPPSYSTTLERQLEAPELPLKEPVLIVA